MQKKTLREYGLKCFKFGKYQVFNKKQFYKIIDSLPVDFHSTITSHIARRFNIKSFDRFGIIVLWPTP